MEPFLSSRFSSSSTALEEDVQEEDVLQDVLRVQVATFNLRAHRSVRVSSLNPHQAWLKDLRMPLKLLNLLGGRGGGVPDHSSLTSQVVHHFQGTIMEANSTRETLVMSICLSPGVKWQASLESAA